MHDPLTVAFEIRRPWPARYKPRTIDGRRVPGYRMWPGIVTVWHRDPSGQDDTTCNIAGNTWRWHVHHWRIQIPALQQVRRRLLTRCTWCGGRHAKADRVNTSLSWDAPRGRWWQGERGLYHGDCSSISSAHACCVCEDPVLEHTGYGPCARCRGYRAYGMSYEALERARVLKAIPTGARRGATG